MIVSRLLTARPLGLAVLLCVGVLSAGCSKRGLFESPLEYASRVAGQKGWLSAWHRGGEFSILTYSSPSIQRGKPLNVYIEGDGYAWVDRYTPAKDPSPTNPVGLSLAIKNKEGGVYLARPCQFLPPNELAECSPVFWTAARFAPEIVQAMGTVIDQLKSEKAAHAIRLHGYSGGGVIAALLAAKRTDVIELVTYASPLDIGAWTSLHNLSPLRYSLNPADEIRALRKIPQTHYVGGKDTEVPPSLAYDFVALLNAESRARVVVVENASHDCCW